VLLNLILDVDLDLLNFVSDRTRRRYALIIGAMKSGTTSLFSLLSQHPEILACREKEPQFFTDDAKFAGGVEAYEKLWPAADDAGGRVWLEASTNYTKLPAFANAADRIATFTGDFRFIYMLRDPIERIESHYTHGLADGWLSENADLKNEPHLINVSRYAMQIAEYYARFPAEKILLLRFEDFAAEPMGALRRICVFLGIDPEFSFRSSDRPMNTNRDRLLEKSPLLGGLGEVPGVSSLARLAPKRLVSLARTRLPRSGGENIRLNADQREFVLKELREDLARLEQEFGFDTSAWRAKREEASR
jgi:hypothetical protein